MAYQSSLEDIEDEIFNWDHAVSSRDFDRSLSAGSAPPSIPQTRIGGRGRGITNPHHMASVRLASEISNLNAHSFPMGHMPTTSELVSRSPENEITPMLRSLGLYSRDDDIHSRNTRKNHTLDVDVRLDGNLPVILNAELFKNVVDDEDEGIEDEVEKYDPDRSLSEQFRTISELSAAQHQIVPEKPKTRSKPKKEKNDSSVDSAIMSSSSASGQSKKGKKKKWRKLTGEELLPKQAERGRYEEVLTIGVHHNPAFRILHSDKGIVGNGRAQ